MARRSLSRAVRATCSKKLNSFEPAADELYEETDEELARIIRSSGSEIGRALETFEMGFKVHVGAEATARRDEREVTWRDLARLGRIEIVELHDLNIAERGDRVGLADVRIFADVHMTQLELQEATPGESEWVTTFDSAITHGFVDIRLAVTFDLHWKVKSVVAAGPRTSSSAGTTRTTRMCRPSSLTRPTKCSPYRIGVAERESRLGRNLCARGSAKLGG